jgi:hypothetical protein
LLSMMEAVGIGSASGERAMAKVVEEVESGASRQGACRRTFSPARGRRCGCRIACRRSAHMPRRTSSRVLDHSLEGNMCGTAMRGADALPGSKATSRAKGSYRNLGGLGSDRSGAAVAGPHREGEEPKLMMNGPEKSDPGIVAMKPANKAEGPSAARPAEEKHAAEPVERRAGTKG